MRIITANTAYLGKVQTLGNVGSLLIQVLMNFTVIGDDYKVLSNMIVSPGTGTSVDAVAKGNLPNSGYKYC